MRRLKIVWCSIAVYTDHALALYVSSNCQIGVHAQAPGGEGKVGAGAPQCPIADDANAAADQLCASGMGQSFHKHRAST